jgi:hypothetical protein
MRARLSFTLLVAGAALAVPAAAATAATTYPTVSKIQPLNLGIGEKLTISGKGYVSGKNRNTVVFKRGRRKAIFAKAETASRTKMTVVVPEKLRQQLAVKDGAPIATKFRVRILAKRFGKAYTTLAKSPRIAPVGKLTGPGGKVDPSADCDGDGIPDHIDTDDDNDTLTDDFEAFLRTDRCRADTDGDGMWDVWEYESALDLNRKALPYPGKRPHPNPLDGGDAMMDYDGDGLWMHQEHALWQAGGRPALLNYSDGDQATGGDVPAPGPGPLGHLDLDGDGWLTDDERDFDGDRLSNWTEANGPLQPTWWQAVRPFKDETPYFNTYIGTEMADRDTDGDGVVDGDDDQDFDGWNNVQEMRRGPHFVHPFNPCLPDPNSRTCSRHIPADLAEKPYPPFNGELAWDHDADPSTPPVQRPLPLVWP